MHHLGRAAWPDNGRASSISCFPPYRLPVGCLVEGVTFVVRVLLLEMRQRPWSGMVFMRHTADIRSHSGLSFRSQAAIIPQVIPADHHVLALLPAGHGCDKVDCYSSNHSPGRS